MYLMTSTRCGISAKHLEREIGVSYPTAHRMMKLIRNELMTQDEDAPLEGEVEVDESAGGGRIRASDRYKGRQHVIAKMSRRPTIWGAVERGGRIRVRVVKSRGTVDAEGTIFEYVLPSSAIFTDEWKGYANRVGDHFKSHKRIRHEDPVYVSGTIHTSTVERFFGNLKNGIRGNCHSVSSNWLQGYLNEYAWRYNRRHITGQSMFRSLIETAAA